MLTFNLLGFDTDIYSLMIMVAIIVIASIAQMGINRQYNIYSSFPVQNRWTGEQAARAFLNANGIYDVVILPTDGVLSDHYNPSTKVIKLSSDVFKNSSISSVAIACHEAGHAIQHKEKYPFLVFRNTIIPIVNFSSSVSWILIVIGLLFYSWNFMLAGLICFGVIAVFQLVTLPVEINASRRAIDFLGGVLTMEENDGATKVLKAAAFTYIASLLTSLLQIMRFLLLFSGRGRRN